MYGHCTYSDRLGVICILQDQIKSNQMCKDRQKFEYHNEWIY